MSRQVLDQAGHRLDGLLSQSLRPSSGCYLIDN
jgi:hypothetical protein